MDVVSTSHLNLRELFSWIGKTNSGNALLARFLPLYSRGIIRLKPMTDAPAELKRETLKADIESAFYYDGVKREIYLSENGSPAFRSVLLFHEMFHSVDEEFLGSYAGLCEHWRIYQSAIEGFNSSASFLNWFEEIRLKRIERAYLKLNDKRLLEAELRAYEAQNEYVMELLTETPSLIDEFQTWEESGVPILKPLRKNDIIEKYGLKSA